MTGDVGIPLERARQLRDRIAQLEAENLRLRGELDAYQGRQVFLCMDRDFPQALAVLHAEHVPAGTRLRATDTGRELVLQDEGGIWMPPR